MAGNRFQHRQDARILPITNNLELNQNIDLGIACSYPYDFSICGRDDCEIGKDTLHYAVGVMGPVLNGNKIADGRAFMQWTQSFNLPVPVLVRVDETEATIGMSSALSTRYNSGRIKDLFGSQAEFERIKQFIGKEKNIADARNVHRFMQEVLYSEF